MAKIPVKFKRITATFDDVARARLCQSSGSEHSPNNSVTDLSDLVDSFFEGDAGDRGESHKRNNDKDRQEDNEYQQSESFCGTDAEKKETLINLIRDGADEDDDGAKRAIRSEVEAVCLNLGNSSSEGFRRRLMTSLRQLGFDAGICKSRWEKTGRHPAGEYEYIDILHSGNRYILEVSLATEFTIARPTKTYHSLLQIIPEITVIKPEELKKVVRLMCAEMRASLKKRDMTVSPWRRNGLMETKWFGSYKRTTNALSTTTAKSSRYGSGDFDGRSLIGFEYSPAAVWSDSYCRKEARRMPVAGNLKTVLFSGISK